MITLWCTSLHGLLVVWVALLVARFVLGWLDCAWGHFVLDRSIVRLVMWWYEVARQVRWRLRLTECLSESFLGLVTGCYFVTVSKDRSSLDRSLKILSTCVRLVKWIMGFGYCRPTFFDLCSEGQGCHVEVEILLVGVVLDWDWVYSSWWLVD